MWYPVVRTHALPRRCPPDACGHILRNFRVDPDGRETIDPKKWCTRHHGHAFPRGELGYYAAYRSRQCDARLDCSTRFDAANLLLAHAGDTQALPRRIDE